MRINSISKKVSGGKAVLSAEIESPSFNNGIKTIFFSFPKEYSDYMPLSADPFFPAVLIPAMVTGEDLEIKPAISKKMIENQSTIQDVFKTWHPDKLRRINVTANSYYEPSANTGRRNATFFSLGVDSMHTMLKHLPKNNPPEDKHLNTLVYMKGLELPLSTYHSGQDKEVIAAIRKVATHYNLDLITGETNMRDIFPLDFVKLYLGPCLASSALSLSEGFKNFFIPSHYSYADLFPVASSPLLDHLWSNDATSIIHDGSDKERAQKVTGLIANDSFALDNLRVCVDNDGGNYNCCKCWKCVRTMLTLEIIGKLEESKAFPEPLPKSYAKELKTFNYDSLIYARENLRLAQKHGSRKIQKILNNEIRIGKLDLLREERSLWFLIRELIYYFSVKTGRRLRILKF